jgi:hypothetical protein
MFKTGISFIGVRGTYISRSDPKWLLITGSFSFTKAAEQKNAENLLIIKSKELAKTYIDNWMKHREHSEKYQEGTNISSSKISEIRQRLAMAYGVVFMGFAFHKLNMQLIYLYPLDVVGRMVKCYATAFELSEIDKEEIKAQMMNIYRNNIDVKMAKSDMKCSQFFKEFWRSLAF